MQLSGFSDSGRQVIGFHDQTEHKTLPTSKLLTKTGTNYIPSDAFFRILMGAALKRNKAAGFEILN